MSKRQTPVVRIVTATEAQNKFGEMLKRTYKSAEHHIIERSGIPVAALVPIADYQRLVPESANAEISRGVATAAQRELAAREMKEPLSSVHERMPVTREDEVETIINAEVAQVRYGKRRAHRRTSHPRPVKR
jgi:prevent-host-death family protein